MVKPGQEEEGSIQNKTQGATSAESKGQQLAFLPSSDFASVSRRAHLRHCPLVSEDVPNE